MNKPPYGTQIRELNPLEMFKVSAQDKPNNTVKINAGTYVVGIGNIVEYGGGNSLTITPPVSGYLWNLICLGPNANIVLSSNAMNPPAIPKNYIGLALIYQRSIDTAISNDMIFDVRPLFASTAYPMSHSDLLNNTASDCHPITAITGLTAALLDKVAVVDNTNDLLTKADIDGTTSNTFTLNKDQTGSPTENAEFIIKRGSEANVSFIYNEDLNKWQFTNDGSEFFDFSNLGSIVNATNSVIGKVKLSVAPASADAPIAVGDNDTRIAAIAGKADLISPSFTTPALGTPASGVLTNCTGTAAGLTAGNVTTNANLTGEVTSVGNATTVTNTAVIGKVLTGYTSGAGVITATDTVLSAIEKLNGNVAAKADLQTGISGSFTVGGTTFTITNGVISAITP